METIRRQSDRNYDLWDGSKREIKSFIRNKKMQNTTKETKRKDKLVAKRKKD